MEFASTRDGARKVSLREAVFRGLAPDGGLYQPTSYPNLKDLFSSFQSNTAFSDVAFQTLVELIGNEIPQDTIRRIVDRAFPFEPRVRYVEERLGFLELFHGPTCAFKDFGASFLASLMEELLLEEHRRSVILVATSGDTGSAVAHAFHRRERIDVVLLYPSGRVSALQEKQLTTLGDNVHALEVEGSFDDCQRMVKQAFQDPILRDSFHLTSANSINCGRLIPQAFYYIYAVAQSDTLQRERIDFCVPSGNFGNLTAGVYAWKWGLPVRSFLAATNVNDVVPVYLRTGTYAPQSSVKTLSNAMDVGAPSNFERLEALFCGDHKRLSSLISGARVSDAETLEGIADAYRSHGVLIDPHTAVGYVAASRRLRGTPSASSHMLVLSTAHPAKFPETVEQVTGEHPGLPPSLEQAMKLPKNSTRVGNTVTHLADYVRRNISC